MKDYVSFYILLSAIPAVMPNLEGPFLFQSENFPSFSLSFHYDDPLIRLSEKGRRFWMHCPGLTGQEDTVSLEAADQPGKFITHVKYELQLESKDTSPTPEYFNTDATFRIHQSLWDQGYMAFESVNYPGYFLRHRSYLLKLERNEDPDNAMFKRDASFRKKEGPYLLQSLHHPWLRLGVDNLYQAMIQESGTRLYIVSPGISGHKNTVSLELKSSPGIYLRDHGSYLNFESDQGPVNPEEYEAEATFYTKPNYFAQGYYALESVKHPGRFIRQLDFRLRVVGDDGTDVYGLDASFSSVQGPYLFEAFNMAGLHITAGIEMKAYLAHNGSSFNLVYPGLNGAQGTVSFQSVAFPDNFLCTDGDTLMLLNKELVSTDAATFFILHQAWREGDGGSFDRSDGDVVSFECYLRRNHYLRHKASSLYISLYEHNEQFFDEATFYRRKGRHEAQYDSPRIFNIMKDSEFSTQISSGPEKTAAAVIGSIFGGIFLGIGITFLALFLLDKFYFKRATANAKPKDSFDNPMYTGKAKSKNRAQAVAATPNEYAVIEKMHTMCSDSEKYDSDV